MKPLLLSAILVGLCTPTISQRTTQRGADEMVAFYGTNGSSLLRSCKVTLRWREGGKLQNAQELGDAMYCSGYVFGIVDEMSAISLQTDTTFCIPSSVDKDQLIRIVAKYLENNPARLHLPGGALVANAINEAFPCK